MTRIRDKTTSVITGAMEIANAVAMTHETADKAMAIAKEIAIGAYWSACDAEGLAIEPGALDIPEGIVDEAYAAALQVERIIEKDGITWAQARKHV